MAIMQETSQHRVQPMGASAEFHPLGNVLRTGFYSPHTQPNPLPSRLLIKIQEQLKKE